MLDFQNDQPFKQKKSEEKKPKESKEKKQQIIPSSPYFSCDYCDKTYQQEIKKQKTRIKMYARQFKRTEENKKQV